MLTHQQIVDALQRHRLIDEVSVVPRGHVRASTTLTCVDGSGIDMFVAPAPGVPPGWHLTDFGETLMVLDQMQARPFERIAEIDAALAGFGVTRDEDRLTYAFVTEAELALGVHCLAEACQHLTEAFEPA